MEKILKPVGCLSNGLKLTGLIAAFLICGYSYGQTVTGAEYFFDADPGVGNGTAITITSPGDSVDVISSINTTGLGAGFHTLFVRAQNSNRIWSLYDGRRFYINAAPTVTQVEIANAEYFFDNDPGVGKGTAISTGALADSVDITTTASTNGLPAGFHNLFVRVQNQSGVWSLYDGRSFYINAPVTNSQPEIVKAEYFVDADPGVGNGTAITTGAAADSIDITSTVNTTGLPAGFHALFVRVQDQNNVWSLYDGRKFYINAPPPNAQLEIVQAEYFIDHDPGVGNGTLISTGALADSVDILSNVNTTGLSVGFHGLFIRVLNQSGVWSLYEGRRFYIDAPLPADTLEQIVNAETFFDVDPGVGNGTTVSPSFAAADSVDFFRSISANGLSPGTHYLMLRVQNDLNQWSLVLGDTFHICGPVPAFNDSVSGYSVYFTDSSQNAVSYLWHFGDGDTSTMVSPMHIYATTGLYNVTLIITDSCGVDSVTNAVNIVITGINRAANNANGATVYPNPNNGNFMLSYRLTSANSELQITDITGRLICSKVISGNDGLQQINISDLSNGIYYWRIASENNISANGKIVIVR